MEMKRAELNRHKMSITISCCGCDRLASTTKCLLLIKWTNQLIKSDNRKSWTFHEYKFLQQFKIYLLLVVVAEMEKNRFEFMSSTLAQIIIFLVFFRHERKKEITKVLMEKIFSFSLVNKNSTRLFVESIKKLCELQRKQTI